MKIAVIGCGEVGLLYAKALVQAGHSLQLCDPAPRAAALRLAAEASLPLHTALGSWLSGADLVISCVLGTVSLAVASEALDHMRAGAVLADMTTSDPEDIRRAASAAATVGISYVDVAVMGAVALTGVRTSLLAAGSGGEVFLAACSSIEAPVRLIPNGVAGDAAAIKILRSVFTKGLEALAVETLLAARRQGVVEQLHDALADIDQAPLRSTLDALIRTHVIHAPRRLKEVEEAERQLQLLDLPVDVLPGVRARFQRTSLAMAARPRSEGLPSVDEALTWLGQVTLPAGDRS
jgi:3-hydroxyisobutyrate dehydrogenase-like beta-hydroxyacid dehydrogenase